MTKQEEIEQLKKERDAVILAHYYTRPEVQAIADYIGDSYYLSEKASSLTAKTIVFCGVSFMGESAKLLNPDRTVLMPDESADCPMAHMVTRETVEAARKKYPGLVVVCYINSTAEIKSWSDVCVTSANAVRIVKKLPGRHVLFIPDRNLARHVASEVPDKIFHYNDGYCPVHEEMSAAEIRKLKEEHRDAQVLVHPECGEEVLALADYTGSTTGIIQYAKNSAAGEFIIGTESGVLYALRQARPDAAFYFPQTEPVCENMKKITLEKIAGVLRTGNNELPRMEDQVSEAAGETLKKMLALA